MPQLSRDWGVPQESAARATTVFAVAYAWGSLAGGPLSDRYGRRTILAGTVAAMAVATALVPLATGLPWASAARALQGLTAGSFVPMSYASLSERVPERLPLALTTVNAAGGASAVISQIEGQVLGSALGWGAVFLVSAPLLAVGALALRRILLPGTVGTPGRDAAGEGGLRVLRSARLLRLLVIVVPLLGSLTAIYTVVQLYGPADLVGDPGAMLGLRASALPAMVLAVLAAPALGRFPPLRRAAASLTRRPTPAGGRQRGRGGADPRGPARGLHRTARPRPPRGRTARTYSTGGRVRAGPDRRPSRAPGGGSASGARRLRGRTHGFLPICALVRGVLAY
ncbi:MFS transporter [Streptomyces sp. M3]|uniref:MFS transporter n=1 Tax=Streptomyces sp. M3 TaxID=295102 RepID=UPI00100E89D8|nr:MFS transporter [Streptomyces sp. M3]